MKNKMFGIVSIILIVALVGVLFVACNGNDLGNPAPVQEEGYVLNPALVADDYVDYADTVYLNTTAYPEISDMGLTIVTGYGDSNYGDVHEVDADETDSATGKSNIELYFDDEKPSIIIIHGIQLGNGREGRCHMGTGNRSAEINSSIYNEDDEIDYFKNDANFDRNHDLSKYWYDGACGQQAYNVFFFHYERFADCLGSGDSSGSLPVGDASYPGIVENYIWSSTSGAKAVYYRNNAYAETESGEALGGYSVAEFFAAEYLRAFNKVDELYPDYKNDSKCNQYIASHSMGGVVSVAGSMLVKLIADDGQIAMKLTPQRLIQMDSFVGMPEVVDETNKLSWTDGAYLKNDAGEPGTVQNYLYSIEGLALKYDVAIDFYINKGLGVPFTCMAEWDYDEQVWKSTSLRGNEAQRILQVSAMVMIVPAFADVNDMMFGEGHNSIREWVLSSYLYDAPKATDADGNEYAVATARATNEEIIALRGTYVEMIPKKEDGTLVSRNSKGKYPAGVRFSETVRCDDDAFNKLK